ncbi:MAG TPA: hypothetical protein VFL74_05745 [Sphingomicrobium sp.]|nr:hypothetical protein [Sphingomicrobium sp.]
MARNNQRGSKNNNPSGRNQYSSDWMGTVRDRPVASAAAAAAAVGAGVFLWSKRNQIGDQISRLSDQVTDWADEMRSGSGSSSRELAMTEGPNESSAIESSRATGSRSGRTARSSGSQSRSSSTAAMTH